MESEVINECERVAALERIARINAEAISALTAIGLPFDVAASRRDHEGHFNLATAHDRAS